MTDKKVNNSNVDDKRGIINFNGEVFIEASENELQLIRIVSSMVTDDIERERENQNKKWGHQIHDYHTWQSIGLEEVGEAAQALNNLMFSGKESDVPFENLYEEVVQASAVYKAWAEQMLLEKYRREGTLK